MITTTKTNDIDYTIIVENLHKSFKRLVVLDGVSFKVKRGSIFALLGPNGAGKTTTIRILSTLLAPDRGKALVCGFNVATHGHQVRQSIGLTGQYAAVDDYLSGIENLQMMGKLYRLTTAQAKKRSTELLQQFDLEDAAKRPVRNYSGGMRRRLDLAMSLIASPPVVFLDEPTTGLDPRSRITMWDTIRKLAQSGITILLTTQYMDEAEHLADHIVVLDNGNIIAEGTVNDLKARVGAARITISLAQENHMEAAQKALQGEDVQIDTQRRALTVIAKNGVQNLKDVIQRLEMQDISINNIALEHPTLDDVFLALTGSKTLQKERNVIDE